MPAGFGERLFQATVEIDLIRDDEVAKAIGQKAVFSALESQAIEQDAIDNLTPLEYRSYLEHYLGRVVAGATPERSLRDIVDEAFDSRVIDLFGTIGGLELGSVEAGTIELIEDPLGTQLTPRGNYIVLTAKCSADGRLKIIKEMKRLSPKQVLLKGNPNSVRPRKKLPITSKDRTALIQTLISLRKLTERSRRLTLPKLVDWILNKLIARYTLLLAPL